jgi:predicted CXXCH cytochrome family protein
MNLALIFSMLLVVSTALTGPNVAAHAATPEPGVNVVAAECSGCHTPARNEPASRFANGLGRWTDAQCYGCHAELNDVATMRARGVRDARYFAVPVSEQKLAALVERPLAYMNAPESVEPHAGSVPRISITRLSAFLRRPASLSAHGGSRAPRMMAYPHLGTEDVREVARLLGVATTPAAAEGSNAPEMQQRIEKLWSHTCAECHEGPRPASGRSAVALGLYAPEWIFAYANGKAAGVRGERNMPIVELSRDDAQGLYRFLGAARAEAERALDARVKELDLPRAGATEDVPDAFVGYLWGGFFRDATCVHCHATSPRAAGAFRADPEGLKAYLRRKSGGEFWRRLEIRALEAEHGLVAAVPGMPMAGVELPAEVRNLVARWVRGGCRAPDGQRFCPNG